MAEAAWQRLGSAAARLLSSEDAWLALLLAVCAAAAGIELLAWLRALRLRWRFWRARSLENKARALLQRRGYRVIDEQVSRRAAVEVDGAPRTYLVRADYLARGPAGELYVVEVKSGQTAPDPLGTATRRQLLEYQLVYAEARGVLLVDMARRALIPVRFALPEPLASDRRAASQ